MILPEIEEAKLYQTIAANSNKFTLSAFSKEVVNTFPRAAAPHCATVELSQFQCPDFTGPTTVDTSPRTLGVAGGATETGTLPPNYANYDWRQNPQVWRVGIAVTNYNAILGTHIDEAGMPATAPAPGRPAVQYPPKSASLPNSNNGGMRFRPNPGGPFDIGNKLAALTDGTSRVPLVAETCERRFSSWYDGTMNWVVAARHSDPKDGTTPITPATMGGLKPTVGGQITRDRWAIGTDGTPSTGGTALNYGPTAEHPTAVYLPTGSLSDPDISGIAPGRLWGPSSQHAGGIVNHAFADAHVEGISDGIDPNVYLWIVTRNGGEPLPAMN
jgi:hypothetical protein